MVFCNMKRYQVLNNVHSHNPYFNRWFSAIAFHQFLSSLHRRHNPYFNRWFSAIGAYNKGEKQKWMSQSLF